MPSIPPDPESGAPEDAIYGEVRKAIGDQKLPPGTRLREDEMRTIFGVSRDRMRKVFARLAHDGLVTIEPNKGASVARPTVREARELFAARRGVEAAIIGLVAPRFTPADRRLLAAHVNRELAADKARDHAEMVRLSGEFHLVLAGLARNAMLAKFLDELITRESLVIQTYEKPGSPSCSGHEHLGIVEALGRRDAEAASRLMAEHLANVEARLDLDDTPPAPPDLSDVFGAKGKARAGRGRPRSGG
ncbi:MAG: GntR family transcriptional regulator [Alsobacter sp.]